MDNTSRLLRLKEQAERLVRDRDRADGALRQLLKRLREEYNCEDIASGEAELDSTRALLRQVEVEYEAELRRVEEEFPEGDEKK